MSQALDTFQLETVKRRRAELAAHLHVIAMQGQLIRAQEDLARFYRAELDEIDAFLASIDEVQRHGDGPHA